MTRKEYSERTLELYSLSHNGKSYEEHLMDKLYDQHQASMLIAEDAKEMGKRLESLAHKLGLGKI